MEHFDSNHEISEINQNDVENSEESKAKKKGPLFWFTVLLLFLGFIILVLLFLPVSKKNLLKLKDKAELVRSEISGYKIGEAGYDVLSASINKSLLPRKLDIGNVYLVVTVRITNLVDESRLLDYSNIRLKDKYGRIYPVNIELTEALYQREKKSSPWDELIKPGKTRIAKAVFIARRSIPGPQLVCRDFDWTRNKGITIPLTIRAQTTEPKNVKTKKNKSLNKNQKEELSER